MTNAEKWVKRWDNIFKKSGEQFNDSAVSRQLNRALCNGNISVIMKHKVDGRWWRRFEFKDHSAIVMLSTYDHEVTRWGHGLKGAGWQMAENERYTIQKRMDLGWE